MKKLWILNRAFHQDIADNLLAVFNEKNEEYNRALARANIYSADFFRQQVIELKVTLTAIQDACVWHINEAHKYSALIACNGVEGLLEPIEKDQ